VCPRAQDDGAPSTSYNGNGNGAAAANGNGNGSDGIQMQPQKRATGLTVRVRAMVKHFSTAKGVFRAVDGVDVDVQPSSIVALLGPSGARARDL
jgi:ABC-type glutathione transport system ATPase component